jgi:glycosyltransferase involved in cell wall biosynthesis
MAVSTGISARDKGRPRKVLVDVLWRLRREWEILCREAPEGYKFVLPDRMLTKAGEWLAGTGLPYAVARQAYFVLRRFMPGPQLLLPWLRRRAVLPPDVDLVFSPFHLVFGRHPWILFHHAELPYLLVGSERVFQKVKGLVIRTLSSEYCRKIIVTRYVAKKAFLQALDAPQLDRKIVVVPWAGQARKFTKTFSNDRVRLLFVNSAHGNFQEHFLEHGGHIVLEAFFHLRGMFPDLELIIRSGISPRLKRKLTGVSNLRIIDRVIPWSELEQLFIGADIFVYPTFVTPGMVILDAMSYELPVVTTDIWGNSEIIRDGETGLLVPYARSALWTDGSLYHEDSPEFRRAVRSQDVALVKGTVERLAVLIQDVELRRRIGRAARWEIEHGEFSMHRMSTRLKGILDEAVEYSERFS